MWLIKLFLGLGLILAVSWFFLLIGGRLFDWAKQGHARKRVFAGLSPYQQNLLSSLEERKFATQRRMDGTPISPEFAEALRQCQEAKIEEWRLLALCD